MAFFDKSLQYMFVETKGKPIQFGEAEIVQMDVIYLYNGIMKFEFKNEPHEVINGFALQVDNGSIELSNGEKVKKVYTWNLKNVDKTGLYKIHNCSKRLMIWNIYQANKKELEYGDYWTNNAGMVVTQISESKRIYSCSDGLGDFDKSDCIFEIEWEER